MYSSIRALLEEIADIIAPFIAYPWQNAFVQAILFLIAGFCVCWHFIGF